MFEVAGLRDDPVVVMGSPPPHTDRLAVIHWGGIRLPGKGSRVVIRHAFIVHSGHPGFATGSQGGGSDGGSEGGSERGGEEEGDQGDGLGHRREAALLDVSGAGASAIISDSWLMDGLGQALQVRQGTGGITMDRPVLSGFTAGGTIQHSRAVIRDCAFMRFAAELRDWDHPISSTSSATTLPSPPSPPRPSSATSTASSWPAFEDGDSDALYVVGGEVNVSRSLFAAAKDDCIDSGTGAGGVLRIEDCWIESCFHEGTS